MTAGRLIHRTHPVRSAAVIAATALLSLLDIGVRNVGLPVGAAAGQAMDLLGVLVALCDATAPAALPVVLPPRWRFCATTGVAAVAVRSEWVAGLVLA